MADTEGATENEKKPLEDVEASYAENEMDDSKAKFINGGMDETKVVIPQSPSENSFNGLGKDELKKYADDPFWVKLRWILFILFWVGWLAMLVSAIVIIVLAPRCPTRPDLKWYHTDALYNTYTKSFLDGDKTQDGYGDLDGLQSKSDYIKELGASSIWLSGILKTSDNDDRAVVDFKQLDEKFGTVESLKAFAKKLMKTGRRLIMDFVPNQTSKNHTWFQSSQKKEGKYDSYYVWAKTDNGWKRADGSSFWVKDNVRKEYYLSQFGDLPDLNLTNPDVMAEFGDAMRYWTANGISGFHINDLEYLAENESFPADNTDFKETRNFDGSYDVVDSLRRIVDGLDNKPGREKMLFGTVYDASTDQIRGYYGGGERRGLHIVNVLLTAIDRNSDGDQLVAALEPFVNISNTNWLGWKLSSARPGSERVVERLQETRMVLGQVLQALLPGTSEPYYGDEIAMNSGPKPGQKTVTPMQWTSAADAGFTKGGKPWLPVNSGYEKKNYESLTAQLGTNRLVDSFKAMNVLRAEESARFGRTMLCGDRNLFLVGRHAPGFSPLVLVLNLGASSAFNIGGSECLGGRSAAELVFHSQPDPSRMTNFDLSSSVHIGEYEALVFKFAP